MNAVVCAFFMELMGNRALLDRKLVAFFASRSSEAEALHLAKQWAEEISHTNKIVISGFHSPIEPALLASLFAITQRLYDKSFNSTATFRLRIGLSILYLSVMVGFHLLPQHMFYLAC